MEDLAPELKRDSSDDVVTSSEDWEVALKHWADKRLTLGESTLLEDAVPRFEHILIEAALKHTGGRRQDAARLLGWGRNTLTRKIKELGMEEEAQAAS